MNVKEINRVRRAASFGAMAFFGTDRIKAGKAVRFAIDRGLPRPLYRMSQNELEAELDMLKHIYSNAAACGLTKDTVSDRMLEVEDRLHTCYIMAEYDAGLG